MMMADIIGLLASGVNPFLEFHQLHFGFHVKRSMFHVNLTPLRYAIFRKKLSHIEVFPLTE